MPDAKAAQSVLKVGDGRGFVVEGHGHRYVVTAAHCLPFVPHAHSGLYLHERTYQALLGPLGAGAPTVWTQCLFVNPVDDIAVLGAPDIQERFEQWEEYLRLVERTVPLSIARPGNEEGEGWLLALDTDSWFRCKVQLLGRRTLWIRDASEPIRGGMSGSPILLDDGNAIAICCASGGGQDLDEQREGGPNPILAPNLPVWIVEELTIPQS